MKIHAVFFVVIFLCAMCGFAYADAYNPSKIAECIEDNIDERASTETVRKYCICMNGKMPAGESQSVTDWEKNHPVERAVCDREAGWR